MTDLVHIADYVTSSNSSEKFLSYYVYICTKINVILILIINLNLEYKTDSWDYKSPCIFHLSKLFILLNMSTHTTSRRHGSAFHLVAKTAGRERLCPSLYHRWFGFSFDLSSPASLWPSLIFNLFPSGNAGPQPARVSLHGLVCWISQSTSKAERERCREQIAKRERE